MISNLLILLTGVGLGIFAGVVLDSAIKSTNFSSLQIARLGLAVAILLSGVSYYNNVSCQATYNSNTAANLAITRKVQIETLQAQIDRLEHPNPEQTSSYIKQLQDLLRTYTDYPIGPSKC